MNRDSGSRKAPTQEAKVVPTTATTTSSSQYSSNVDRIIAEVTQSYQEKLKTSSHTTTTGVASSDTGRRFHRPPREDHETGAAHPLYHSPEVVPVMRGGAGGGAVIGSKKPSPYDDDQLHRLQLQRKPEGWGSQGVISQPKSTQQGKSGVGRSAIRSSDDNTDKKKLTEERYTAAMKMKKTSSSPLLREKQEEGGNVELRASSSFSSGARNVASSPPLSRPSRTSDDSGGGVTGRGSHSPNQHMYCSRDESHSEEREQLNEETQQYWQETNDHKNIQEIAPVEYEREVGAELENLQKMEGISFMVEHVWDPIGVTKGMLAKELLETFLLGRKRMHADSRGESNSYGHSETFISKNPVDSFPYNDPDVAELFHEFPLHTGTNTNTVSRPSAGAIGQRKGNTSHSSPSSSPSFSSRLFRSGALLTKEEGDELAEQLWCVLHNAVIFSLTLPVSTSSSSTKTATTSTSRSLPNERKDTDEEDTTTEAAEEPLWEELETYLRECENHSVPMEDKMNMCKKIMKRMSPSVPIPFRGGTREFWEESDNKNKHHGNKKRAEEGDTPFSLFRAAHWRFVVCCAADMGYPRSGELCCQMPHRCSIDELLLFLLWLTQRYAWIHLAIVFQEQEARNPFVARAMSSMDSLNEANDSANEVGDGERKHNNNVKKYTLSRSPQQTGEDHYRSKAASRSPSPPPQHPTTTTTTAQQKQLELENLMQEVYPFFYPSLDWPPPVINEGFESFKSHHTIEGDTIGHSSTSTETRPFPLEACIALHQQRVRNLVDEATAHHSRIQNVNKNKGGKEEEEGGRGHEATKEQISTAGAAAAIPALYRLLHYQFDRLENALIRKSAITETLGLTSLHDFMLCAPGNWRKYNAVSNGLHRLILLPKRIELFLRKFDDCSRLIAYRHSSFTTDIFSFFEAATPHRMIEEDENLLADVENDDTLRGILEHAKINSEKGLSEGQDGETKDEDDDIDAKKEKKLLLLRDCLSPSSQACCQTFVHRATSHYHRYRHLNLGAQVATRVQFFERHPQAVPEEIRPKIEKEKKKIEQYIRTSCLSGYIAREMANLQEAMMGAAASLEEESGAFTNNIYNKDTGRDNTISRNGYWNDDLSVYAPGYNDYRHWWRTERMAYLLQTHHQGRGQQNQVKEVKNIIAKSNEEAQENNFQRGFVVEELTAPVAFSTFSSSHPTSTSEERNHHDSLPPFSLRACHSALPISCYQVTNVGPPLPGTTTCAQLWLQKGKEQLEKLKEEEKKVREKIVRMGTESCERSGLRLLSVRKPKLYHHDEE